MSKRGPTGSRIRTVKPRNGEYSIEIKEVFPFGNLPNELQTGILQFADPIRLRTVWIKLQLVCKKWRNISQEMVAVSRKMFVDTRESRIFSALKFAELTGYTPLCRVSIFFECEEHQIPITFGIDGAGVNLWIGEWLGEFTCKRGHAEKISVWEGMAQKWRSSRSRNENPSPIGDFLVFLRSLLEQCEGDLRDLSFLMQADLRFGFRLQEGGEYLECVQYPPFCYRDGENLACDRDIAKEMGINPDGSSHSWFERHKIRASFSDLGKVQVSVKKYQRLMWE